MGTILDWINAEARKKSLGINLPTKKELSDIMNHKDMHSEEYLNDLWKSINEEGGYGCLAD